MKPRFKIGQVVRVEIYDVGWSAVLGNRIPTYNRYGKVVAMDNETGHPEFKVRFDDNKEGWFPYYALSKLEKRSFFRRRTKGYASR